MKIINPFSREKKPYANNATITFTMSERTFARFDALMVITKSPNAQTLFRNAMRLYDAMVQEHEDGNKMAVIKPDGTVVPYEIFYADQPEGTDAA